MVREEYLNDSFQAPDVVAMQAILTEVVQAAEAFLWTALALSARAPNMERDTAAVEVLLGTPHPLVVTALATKE